MQDIKNSINKIFKSARLDNLIGYALGIYNDGKTNFYSEGKASLENNSSIDDDTNFHIASLTKHFTAIVFRQIELQGLINENDLLADFFPAINMPLSNITLKHLLNHTSGLRDQWELAELSGWREHDVITSNDIVNLLSKQQNLNFEPGSQYAYSNSGYTLLALILEKVTGVSIKLLIEKYILQACNTNSPNYYSYKDIIPRLATPYSRNPKSEENYQINKPNFDVVGSTSMFASIKDLMAIEEEFYKSEHENDDSVENSGSYRDGLIRFASDGNIIQMHSGWDYGYSAYLLRVISSKISVIILCNYGVSNLFLHALNICAFLDKNLSKSPVLSLNLGISENDTSSPSTYKEGFYLNKNSNCIFKIENNRHLSFQGNRLLQMNTDVYTIEKSINSIKFIDSASFAYYTLGFSLLFEHLEVNDDPIILSNYVGEYYSTELDVTYTILMIEDKLLIQAMKFVQYELSAVTSEYFISDKFSIRFATKHDIVSGFTLSNLRLWNLSFDKI